MPSRLKAWLDQYIHKPHDKVFRDHVRTRAGLRALRSRQHTDEAGLQVFLEDEWRWHQNWRRHLPGMAGVHVFVRLSPVIVFFTLEAFCVCAYHQWLEKKGAPSFWNNPVDFYFQMLGLTSFVLSLLLVFRTNSAYARWWEARTEWGHVLNSCRNLVRKATAYFPPSAEKELAVVVRWTYCLPYLLKSHLLQRVAPEPERYLPPHELAWLREAQQPCLRAAEVLTLTVAKVAQDTYQAAAMDEIIVEFVKQVGACERISRTPIPLAYTRHLSRFMSTWLLFLPFGMWPIIGWATPGMSCVVSFLLIGAENIGIQIENPFAVIFMGVISDNIADSIHELLEAHQDVHAVLAGKAVSRAVSSPPVHAPTMPVTKAQNGRSLDSPV